MSNIDEKIFNSQKTDYETPSLFLGTQPGLFDTVNKNFPKIWNLYKLMKSLDWDENEFDYSSCNVEFKTCPKSIYDIMIRTLAWQWEADSVAARAIAPITAPFVSSTELWAVLTSITTNEVVHGATYSEIVRNSFDDPAVVLDEVLKVKASLSRLSTISAVMSKTYDMSHKYALGLVENDQETYNSIYMFFVAMYCLERIQFMASFAITFSICDTGMFLPIGKAVQKIAQEELEVHAENDRVVLEYEAQTERGQTAFIQCKDLIQKLIDEVVECEINWLENDLFSEGRELAGTNADLCVKWVLFNAKPVYNFFGLKSPRPLPEKNPMKFMENWLNIGNTQPSPQEQANGQYKLNVMRRDDANEEFDADF